MLSDIISAANDTLYSYILIIIHVVGGTSAFIESTTAQIYRKKEAAPRGGLPELTIAF